MKSLTPVGITVIATFIIIWSPFLVHGSETVLQVLSRVFPFYRGLYEVSTCFFHFNIMNHIRIK
ncbi:MAG: hypothetical protein DI538_27720 [Azospira oryzae]|nr:MAG: hypothetical protein DI538_27720 [Azospira oryzae]